MHRWESASRRLVGLAALVFVSLSLGVGLPHDVEAARGRKADKSSDAGGQKSLISRDRAAGIARSATGGRVLNIQLKRGKRPKYSVKMLLDEKRVKKVTVDAQTGAILK